MKTLQRELCAIAVILASLYAGAASASPDSTPDAAADIVYLREDCTVDGSPMENCFESMDALSGMTRTGNPPTTTKTGWIWTTRTSTRPLLVDIGPGEFGQFECDDDGDVTLRGSGREQTIIADSDTGMFIRNCQNLSFIDLGVRGDRIGVEWYGGGFSTWANTDIVVTGEAGTNNAAWYDSFDLRTVPTFICGKHYFNGSRVRSLGSGTNLSSAYYSQCGESWFFGGEIVMEMSNELTAGFGVANTVRITHNTADVRLFGTAVRALVVAGGEDFDDDLIGVYVNAGHFHSHGSIVNVDANGSDNSNAFGLWVQASGHAHTPGTAWVVKADGSGTATRVHTTSGGMAESPFHWQAGSAPPAVVSEQGSDIYVETDCDSTDCTGGSEPHLMVYSTSCSTGGPWFDTVRAACRVN